MNERTRKREKPPQSTKSSGQETEHQSYAFRDNRPENKQLKKLQENANEFTASKPIQKKENKTGLPDQLKTGIENLSGHSMDDVKVHYNSPKPSQLQAHAFAQGTNIHLASGQEKHLPHEAWHVVQQKQGRVKPTMQVKGENINDDISLEKEADVMGNKASSDTIQRRAHSKSCNCASCTGVTENISNKVTLQKKVAQLVCSECGRRSGHTSRCSRHPNRRRAQARRTTVAREESSSWTNMQRYRPGWVRRNDITEAKVNAFCRQYSQRRIRGHHSDDDSSAEHANTTADLTAYKSWHTGIYGWR